MSARPVTTFTQSRPLRRTLLLLLLPACGPSSPSDCDDPVCIPQGPCLGDAHTFFTAIAPLHFTTGDVNGDGRIDVVAMGVDESGAVIGEVHFGDTDTLFAPPQPLTAAGCSAFPLTTDIDGDGTDDLVFPACDGGIDLFWGSGTRPATASTYVPLPLLLQATAVGDLDGDQQADLLALGPLTDGSMALSTVKGGGRALTSSPATTLALGFAPTGMALVASSPDQPPDVILWASQVPEGAAVLHNDGTGQFADPQPLALGTAARTLTVGALRSRDSVDVLLTDPQGRNLWLLPFGDPGPATSTTTFPVAPTQGQIVAVRDASAPLAVVVDGIDPEVLFYEAASDLRLREAARLSTPYAAQLLLAPDIDADGHGDVFVGHMARGAFSLWIPE